ncbi:MAG: hypothetical protein RLZ57_203 [Actinomycetota bacterium]|jgi:O-succinylbenzoate synthase
MIEELLASVQVFSLSTRTNFRGINTREVAIIKGPKGYGEFSPFLEYGEVESIPWLDSAIEAAYSELPALKLTEIEVNATLPEVTDENTAREILSWYPGCKTVKIKVGSNLESDLARISWAKAANFENIRLDINGAWTLREAKENLSEITNAFNIEYVEQPCSTIEELRALELDIPIVGDEILRKAGDPFAIDLTGAVDILMLKVAPLGGINRSIQLAEHHKLPVVVSSAFESAVGITHGLKLASILNITKPAGLATGALLKEDLGTHPINNGFIRVSDVVPSGINYLPRLDWWRERIRNTFAAGERAGWKWSA